MKAETIVQQLAEQYDFEENLTLAVGWGIDYQNRRRELFEPLYTNVGIDPADLAQFEKEKAEILAEVEAKIAEMKARLTDNSHVEVYEAISGVFREHAQEKLQEKFEVLRAKRFQEALNTDEFATLAAAFTLMHQSAALRTLGGAEFSPLQRKQFYAVAYAVQWGELEEYEADPFGYVARREEALATDVADMQASIEGELDMPEPSEPSKLPPELVIDHDPDLCEYCQKSFPSKWSDFGYCEKCEEELKAGGRLRAIEEGHNYEVLFPPSRR